MCIPDNRIHHLQASRGVSCKNTKVHQYVTVMEPIFMGHQLIGSSMLVRFSSVVLGKKPEHDSNGTSRIGLCVSGQTTCQLSRRLKTYPYLSGQIIMMIGVNDFKKGTRISTIKNRLISIIRFLEKKGVAMVLLTLPPIPILRGEREEEILGYNKFILRLGERPAVRVVDIHHLFKNPDGTNNLDLFERYIGNPLKKRLDLVHWNRRGIHKVEEVLRHFLSI